VNSHRVDDGIFHYFVRVAEKYSDKAALIQDGEVTSYSRLLTRVFTFICRMKDAPAGVALNVGILLPNCPDYAASVLAVAALGGRAVLLNPRLSSTELSWYDREIGLDFLITSGSQEEYTAPGGSGIGAKILLLEDIPDIPDIGEVSLPGPVAGTDPLLFLGTSGTTGVPKIAMRSHRSLLANTASIRQALQADDSDIYSGVVPFCHSFGISCGMFLPLLSGGTTICQDRFIPQDLVAACRNHRITVLSASPMIYSMLAQSEASSADFSSARICLSSGARLADSLLASCREGLNLKVRQLYGSSEMGSVAITGEDDPVDPDCVGKPLPGVEVQISRERTRQKVSEEIGEILVRSPSLMSGYYSPESGKEEVFNEGFFHSGDLGRLDSEGRIYLEGRIKRMINVCGIKVDPVEIEMILEQMPGVRKAFVSGTPGNQGMEYIAANLILEPGVRIRRTDLVRFCRGRMAEFKIPRVISFRADGEDPLGK